MRRFALFLFGAVCLLVGCTASPHILGTPPDSTHLTAISEARTLVNTTGKKPFTFRGTLFEKCPTAACWFRMRDKTGVVKVDVKGAYFTVAEVPVGSEVTVSGTWEKNDGEPVLAASGLRY